MKKELKTKITKEKILNSAIKEFGEKGYFAAKINNICSDGISKGLLYHNYKDKDELYLACVETIFNDITNYLKNQEINNDFEKYTKVRLKFFNENKEKASIFFEAVIKPPHELREEIQSLKKGFDSFNEDVYDKILLSITLREGVSKIEAKEYFKLMQNAFNGYFSSPTYNDMDISDIIVEHEDKLSSMLNYMLYGIAEKRS
ncbi:MAG: TetR/AcrR family transcriptional regulator [Peptostreptococcus sp.]|uniref:TetR/AcrR family transcriptional regulator n=1 Tax=Peptostreptococcus sp. TaxID=1262 RepID=UPI002FC9E70E